MKLKHIFFFMSIFVFLSGCLTYRFMEYQITFNDQQGGGNVTVRISDIRSSAAETENQKNDFTELIKYLQEDAFLLDAVADGLYIKERKLWEENGMLVSIYNGIFRNLKIDGNEFIIKNDERILMLELDEGEIIETNGKMTQTEKNVMLTWPVSEKNLIIKSTLPAPQESFPLVNYYRDWQQAQK